MIMLGSIVVCLFLAVPRSRILIASLTNEPLQAAFTAFKLLVGFLSETSRQPGTR